MKTETNDILADKRKHIAQVLKMVSIYCRKQRMLDFDLRILPPEAVDRIGNEIVDLFADRIQCHQRNSPPETGGELRRGEARGS
ncbi:MAG: hypothetical protein CMI67_12800 [Pelagibaca sp.]|nr:hypothetical protein [Pelagibaca sp.]